MITDVVTLLFKRDLAKLKTELELYKNENSLWSTEGNVSNSAGNLCLHLLGNIQYFIGTQLGQTGYVRNREQEFTQKNVSRATLLADIDAAIALVEQTLPGLSEEQLNAEFPIEMQNAKRRTGDVLVLLTAHLAYHLGQINYHRRLLDK